MKKVFSILLATILLATSFAVVTPSSKPAKAYGNNNMIDDAVFDNSGSMSTVAIQNFLNQFPNSCLKNYSDAYPNDYFSYGAPVSAATVIRRVSDLWGINPQVMLTKLEQEENLVTGNAGCPLYRYVSAVGFNCPGPTRNAVYNGTAVVTCVQNDANMGFSRQVTKGAWLLKWGKERANGNLSWLVPDDASYYYRGPMTQGNRQRSASSPVVYYDGYWNGVHLDSGATASLYNYTPYLNQAFPSIFEGFFGAGSTSATPRDYSLVSASTSVLWSNPGQTLSGNTITIRNTGYTTWYPDDNIPPGQHPTRLALAGYQNSPFADTTDPAWLGTKNQIKMVGSSSVAPGQNATFTFRFKGPFQYINGYIHRFVPVTDSVAFFPDRSMYFANYNVPSAYSFVSASGPPSTMYSNQKNDLNVVLKNTGTAPWYADGSVPAGARPTRLVGVGYQGTPYANTHDPAWLGTNNQIKMTPSVVNPGENATFSFSYVGPFSGLSNTFRFYPSLDGVGPMQDIGMGFATSTPARNTSYQFVSSIDPPTIMAPGSVANVQITLKNTGSVVWRNEANGIGAGNTRLGMTQPYYRASKFYSSADTNWLSSSQIGLTTATVAPGQNGVFNFQWKAPTQPGTYTEWFAPVLDSVQWMPDIGMGFKVIVQ